LGGIHHDLQLRTGRGMSLEHVHRAKRVAVARVALLLPRAGRVLHARSLVTIRIIFVFIVCVALYGVLDVQQISSNALCGVGRRGAQLGHPWPCCLPPAAYNNRPPHPMVMMRGLEGAYA